MGIEQATTSVSLESFQFPQKTVLVLGKEKEGLPVALLYLMDHIIEIPQFGWIKSLNVHVSGSLVVFYSLEYIINFLVVGVRQATNLQPSSRQIVLCTSRVVVIA